MITSIIIDDTRMARKELRFLLENFKNVRILDEAKDVDDAIEKITKHRPDIIFLDIQMPGKSGFDLLQELDDTPEVIFTTAYDEYAIKAFEYNALDYLQKPITEERLTAAIKRYEKVLENDRLKNRKILTEDSQVFVKEGDRCWFVKLKDIRLFEIEDTHTKIFFNDQTPTIPKTLNYMETRLDPESFFRVNRQQIINLKWIEKVEPWFSGSIRVYLKDGTEIDVSRRQTLKFKEIMSF